MRKYIVEFIGTFFLVSGAILYGAPGAASALVVMVYAGGHISGAHYNPAVTTAMYIRRKITSGELVGYYLSQLLAGLISAALIYYVFEMKNIGHDSCDGFRSGVMKTALAEIIGTFALAYVILNVATAKGTAGNSFYGLAIGGTVLAMAWAFGSFSGGVFNPAVGLGLAVQGSICWNQLWMFFVAPLIGGVLASYTFITLNKAEMELESIPEEKKVRIEDSSRRSV